MQRKPEIDKCDEIGKNDLAYFFQGIRQQTEKICSLLMTEDYVIQGMPDVSPPKWHLAHTTWFFEAFILTQNVFYKMFKSSYHYLFNSYYLGINQPYPRDKRGLLARPSVKEIYAYRQYVNQAVLDYIDQASVDEIKQLYPLIRLGLEHEQQHQELILMDIKYNFSLNPEFLPYFSTKNLSTLKSQSIPLKFIKIQSGLVTIGYQGHDFCFDNELPHHQKLISDFYIANRLVTNGEYLDFLLADGYKEPTLWLSDGWTWKENYSINKPLYWHSINNTWYEFTLSGLKPLHLAEPVSHISYFEAEAYARWKQCRLPTEEEWEHVATSRQLPYRGNFLEQGLYHPSAISQTQQVNEFNQFFGDLWEWTASPYTAYPHYKPLAGLVSEYNGKFMNNQYVLRGGCCVTPKDHIRPSYRNFYQPDKRWQFSGLRLAKDY